MNFGRRLLNADDGSATEDGAVIDNDYYTYHPERHFSSFDNMLWRMTPLPEMTQAKMGTIAKHMLQFLVESNRDYYTGQNVELMPSEAVAPSESTVNGVELMPLEAVAPSTDSVVVQLDATMKIEHQSFLSNLRRINGSQVSTGCGELLFSSIYPWWSAYIPEWSGFVSDPSDTSKGYPVPLFDTSKILHMEHCLPHCSPDARHLYYVDIFLQIIFYELTDSPAVWTKERIQQWWCWFVLMLNSRPATLMQIHHNRRERFESGCILGLKCRIHRLCTKYHINCILQGCPCCVKPPVLQLSIDAIQGVMSERDFQRVLQSKSFLNEIQKKRHSTFLDKHTVIPAPSTAAIPTTTSKRRRRNKADQLQSRLERVEAENARLRKKLKELGYESGEEPTSGLSE